MYRMRRVARNRLWPGLVSAVFLTTLAASSAKAGLQAAIFAAIDSAEASDRQRAFIPPVAGMDDPQPCTGADCTSATPLVSSSVVPELIYDDLSGHLSASIPAVSLNKGGEVFPYWAKIYSIARVSFDTRLFQRNVASPNSAVLDWQNGGGPLEILDTTPIVSEDVDHYSWAPTDRSLFPSFRPAAAIIDFGNALPPGLTEADFARLSVGDSSANYVDYFNHRGVVSLHLPLRVVVVPEPTTDALLLFAACLVIAALNIRFPRNSAVLVLRTPRGRLQ
jgi:hypothetical protein